VPVPNAPPGVPVPNVPVQSGVPVPNVPVQSGVPVPNAPLPTAPSSADGVPARIPLDVQTRQTQTRQTSHRDEHDRTIPLAIVLFVGLIVHGLLAEVAARAPTAVTSQASLVKKVVFPLEVLPAVAVGAALFHAAASVAVLLLGLLAFAGGVPSTALLLPVVLAPLVVLLLGVAWILASIGTYLRDVGPTVAIASTMLLFLAPIFYPASSVPEDLRRWLLLNPLTLAVEESRGVLLDGRLPHWGPLGAYAIVALAVAMLGFAWFQRTRRGFADVL